MRQVLSLFLTALLGVVAAGPAAAQTRNQINGFVFDASRRPVMRVRVELLDENGTMITSQWTDSGGRYQFSGLSQGTFQVRVVPAGTNYVGQTMRVMLINSRGASGAHYEQVDFYLQSKEAAPGGATNPGVTFAQEVPDGARKAYEAAVKHLERPDGGDQGMAALKQAIDIFPSYYLALERLGAEYVKRQQYEPARATLAKAVEVNPSGHLSLYALGVAYYQLRQMPEAAEALRRALTLAPGSANAPLENYYLGLALVKDGKAGEAEAYFRKASETGGKAVPADVHMHLAQIYSNNKKYKEAADELEFYLRRTPDARDAESIKNIVKQLRAKAK